MDFQRPTNPLDKKEILDMIKLTIDGKHEVWVNKAKWLRDPDSCAQDVVYALFCLGVLISNKSTIKV